MKLFYLIFQEYNTIKVKYYGFDSQALLFEHLNFVKLD